LLRKVSCHAGYQAVKLRGPTFAAQKYRPACLSVVVFLVD
jgi:hypothetical protein